MDERGEKGKLMSLVDLYVAEIGQSVEALRDFRGACPECGEFDHDGCLLLDGPKVSDEEFASHALASLLQAAGGFAGERGKA